MKVLEAVRKLIRVQRKGTVAQIAKVAKVPFAVALDVLDANRGLIRIDTHGRVFSTRLGEHRQGVVNGLYQKGKAYRPGVCMDYGSVTVIQIEKDADPELFERLSVDRSFGGLGDSYHLKVIFDTPENRKALEDAGMQDITTISIPDEDIWKEGE